MSSELSPTDSSTERIASHPELPAGWRAVRWSNRRAQFGYGSHIEIEIEPRYRTKRAQRTRRPSAYRVRLRKRYYAYQLTGDATVLGSVDSFEAAEELAFEYMQEFVADRQEVAMETRRELEADPVMSRDAEETLITEAATEAAIDVAGYSDDLLVTDLRGLLESGDVDDVVLQAVVHRQGEAYDTVYLAEGHEAWGQAHRLREFYKEFDWLNEQKLATTLKVGELTMLMGVFEETRMLRYLASADEETLILIDPEHPIHVPPFERQVADIVAAKWGKEG